MLRVFADDTDAALSLDNLALLAHGLNGYSNLHSTSSSLSIRLPTTDTKLSLQNSVIHHNTDCGLLSSDILKIVNLFISPNNSSFG
jgi:hypothetical protein